MISKPKAISDDKKRILSNFFSLSVLQGANYLLPLITLPYLVRVLGPEKFGLIAFAQAFIQYFVILTDYGFNLSAAREISIHRDNKQKVSEIFCSVLFIKFVLMALSLILLCAIVFSFEKLTNEWQIYFSAFGIVIGQVLFPVWFFQGMERMKFIAFLNIASKLFFTISIFVIVKNTSDYAYVPLLNSLGFVITGLVSILLVFKHFRVTPKIPSFAEIKWELKNGWHIFISTIAINLYTTSNTIILGLFTNNTIVGYYAAGAKIIKAVQNLLVPVSQSIYPHISKLADQSQKLALAFIKKVAKLIGLATFTLSLALLLLAPFISRVVLGSQFTESVRVIRLLSFLPFIVALSNIFGIQTMLNFGLKKTFTKILTSSAVVNIVLALILAPSLHHIGISLSVLITEVFVTSCMFVSLQRNGLKLFTPIHQRITK